MVDVSELQGYLMKEKSKTGILHGLTGDINKRFFKVQKIEVKIERITYHRAALLYEYILRSTILRHNLFGGA